MYKRGTIQESEIMNENRISFTNKILILFKKRR